MTHGFPEGAGAGVGQLFTFVSNNEPPERTDEVSRTLPGICISAASGQVTVLTTEETK